MGEAAAYAIQHLFYRARVFPIGNGLGCVLAEIIRYVKRFYNSGSVPFVIIGTCRRSGLALHRCI